MGATTDSPFQIYDELFDLHYKYGYYRIIIPKSSSVKYLAQPDPKPLFPRNGGQALNFTTVPDGDWNIGYLAPHNDTNKYFLASTAKIDLAGIVKLWHPHKIDWMTLNRSDDAVVSSDLQTIGMPYNICKNHFGFEQVVVYYEWMPDSVYGAEHETEIYALIDSHQIAPKFLAHIMENCGGSDGNGERVIGFMVEKVTNARRATIADLSACKEVLTKLHALNIAYGQIQPENFLIVDDETKQIATNCALLQQFSGAYQTSDQRILDVEMKSLEFVLQQAAASGGHGEGGSFTLSREQSDQIHAISNRDGGLHHRVIEQARKGGITIAEEEHRGLLREWKREATEHSLVW